MSQKDAARLSEHLTFLLFLNRSLIILKMQRHPSCTTFCCMWCPCSFYVLFIAWHKVVHDCEVEATWCVFTFFFVRKKKKTRCAFVYWAKSLYNHIVMQLELCQTLSDTFAFSSLQNCHYCVVRQCEYAWSSTIATFDSLSWDRVEIWTLINPVSNTYMPPSKPLSCNSSCLAGSIVLL